MRFSWYSWKETLHLLLHSHSLLPIIHRPLNFLFYETNRDDDVIFSWRMDACIKLREKKGVGGEIFPSCSHGLSGVEIV